ncbi:bifunctional adenosylcobinamide kinase/adenosylcobinamide-phosphate guanylyltransferase [Pantoea sp. 18069]|uniref:bifunctional adenosylcobinamide kinase/adenosylcobinamide-phosphate guanylyltransferase n=1 Tax=Pantoea sp. 18069 TaxID=2681415 RepID=UPI0013576C55|nr:bifunctional adenosylcobinamide kinase/adenosylcobinamide-phosphate guanylyltransferase [Pantoea sp. 18069]
MTAARSELILGGQKSGKSRRAENLAREWLAPSPARSAWLLATGQAWDAEMQTRIARHQRDRAERVPGLRTLEVPLDLASAVRERSQPDCLLVIDCLTMWLTNWMMPMTEHLPGAQRWAEQADAFMAALARARGPVVIVGNEIGLGVIPLGSEVRAFVDALGVLNQRVAATCSHATLMCAGLPLVLKGGA